jgi:Flp pilus assembly protein CpaB
MATGKKKSGGRTLILLALILIFGLIAAFLLLRNRLFNGVADMITDGTTQEEDQPPVFEEATVVDIYVLTQPLKRGQVFEEIHLLKVAYPREKFIEGLFVTNPADAIGKRALFDLEAGVPLTFGLISDTAEGSYASFMIPSGYVAVTIPIDDELGLSAVAYTLRPGDHVNVIGSMLFVDLDQEYQTKLPNVIVPVYSPAATDAFLFGDPADEEAGTEQIPSYFIPLSAKIDAPSGLMPYLGTTGVIEDIGTLSGNPLNVYLIPSEEQRPRLVSQTIIQDAIVLWVGQYPIEDEETVPDAPIEDSVVTQPQPTGGEEPVEEEVVMPKVVTLVVSPQDAVTLNYLILQKANLSLALRAAGDDVRIDTESVTLQFIMQQYNIPMPSPQPFGVEPRIDSLDIYEEVPVYITP